MDVTMRCQDRTATLFRGGEPVSGAYRYMYTIPFVQLDDEAEFKCQSGSSVVARNLSVQGIHTIEHSFFYALHSWYSTICFPACVLDFVHCNVTH